MSDPIDPTRLMRVREALNQLTETRENLRRYAGVSKDVWYRTLKDGKVSWRTFRKIEDAVFASVEKLPSGTRRTVKEAVNRRRADREFIWRLDGGQEVFVLYDLKPVPDGACVWVTGYAPHFQLHDGDMLYVQGIKRTWVLDTGTPWPDISIVENPACRSRLHWPNPAEPSQDFVDYHAQLFRHSAARKAAEPDARGRINYHIRPEYRQPWVPAELHEALHEWDGMTAAERDIAPRRSRAAC